MRASLPSRRLILGLSFAAALAGCAPRLTDPSLFDASAAGPYRLAGGDRVRVIVFGQPSLSNAYSVGGAGSVSFPLIGDVRALGRTTDQLAAAIAGKLRGGYLRDPQVSVEVQAYRPFFVLGEVSAAGQFPFIEGMTVRQAVALAGGYTARADRSGARVTRAIDGVTHSGDVSLDFPLRPGDTVTVKERFF
ncbi:MAG: polysaccharide export protein [Hyphomicrobiales bacterium]|nr:polysaccharide export protein [Hyphomicrobiales bacterium]